MRPSALSAYLLLIICLATGHGFFNPVLVLLMTGALVAVLAAFCGEWRAGPAALLHPTTNVLIAACVVVSLLHLGRYALSPSLFLPDAPHPEIVAGIVVTGILAILSLRGSSAPRYLFAAVLVVSGMCGCRAIRSLPIPPIDVWHFHHQACEHLLSGENPYAVIYPNIYRHTNFYGSKNLTGDAVNSFPYLPGSLYCVIPGYLLGEIRYAGLLAILAGAGFLAAVIRQNGFPPGRPPRMIPLLWLIHPCGLIMVNGAWNESFLALALSVYLYATTRSRPWLASVSLGCLLGIKQYAVVLLVPLIAGKHIRAWQAFAAIAFAAAFSLPFLVWDPAGFWRGTVLFQMRQPFREDALSVLSLIKWAGGPRLPSICGFAAMGFVGVLVVRRGEVPLSRTLCGAAAMFMAFFLFSKQAFLNYYWFTGTLILAALAVDPASYENKEATSD